MLFIGCILLYVAFIVIDIICFRRIMAIAVPLSGLGVLVIVYILYFLGSFRFTLRRLVLLSSILAAVSIGLFLLVMPRFSAIKAESILKAEGFTVTDEGEYETMITGEELGPFIEEAYFFYCIENETEEKVLILFNPGFGTWEKVGSW